MVGGASAPQRARVGRTVKGDEKKERTSGGGGCGGAEHARSFPCDKARERSVEKREPEREGRGPEPGSGSRETKRRQERAAAGGVGVQNTRDRSLATRERSVEKRERGGRGPEPGSGSWVEGDEKKAGMSGGGGCGGAEHARSFPCDKGTICGKERERGGQGRGP